VCEYYYEETSSLIRFFDINSLARYLNSKFTFIYSHCEDIFTDETTNYKGTVD